jgi:hypothetical protein
MGKHIENPRIVIRHNKSASRFEKISWPEITRMILQESYWPIVPKVRTAAPDGKKITVVFSQNSGCMRYIPKKAKHNNTQRLQ